MPSTTPQPVSASRLQTCDVYSDALTDNAGGGGFSESGSAEGGDAAGPTPPAGVRRRAGDNGTAGGNAYSGATSDVSGGSVVNSADDQGTITNDGGSKFGHCMFGETRLTCIYRHCWRRGHYVLW